MNSPHYTSKTSGCHVVFVPSASLMQSFYFSHALSSFPHALMPVQSMVDVPLAAAAAVDPNNLAVDPTNLTSQSAQPVQAAALKVGSLFHCTIFSAFLSATSCLSRKYPFLTISQCLSRSQPSCIQNHPTAPPSTHRFFIIKSMLKFVTEDLASVIHEANPFGPQKRSPHVTNFQMQTQNVL